MACESVTPALKPAVAGRVRRELVTPKRHTPSMSRAYLRADCGYRFDLLREVLLRSLSCVRWLALAALFQCSAPAFAAGDTERTSAPTDTQPVDPAWIQPQFGAVRSEWLTRIESSGGNRRWTLSRGAVEFGLGAGSIHRSERTSGNEFDDPKALSPLPALSIGWRDVAGS